MQHNTVQTGEILGPAHPARPQGGGVPVTPPAPEVYTSKGGPARPGPMEAEEKYSERSRLGFSIDETTVQQRERERKKRGEKERGGKERKQERKGICWVGGGEGKMKRLIGEGIKWSNEE